MPSWRIVRRSWCSSGRLVAVQEAAFVELQVSVVLAPLGIEAEAADSEAVGTGAIVTVAVAAVLVPPAPLQISE